jgi:hypothetical protein
VGVEAPPRRRAGAERGAGKPRSILGVYYRNRVGPFASADALKIDGSYRAAGGEGIIAH